MRIRARFEAVAGRVALMPARWDLAAALLYAVVSLLIYRACPEAYRPSSDGHYSWMYARSLAYDGDLDLTNDYGLCGDPFAIGWATPAHRPANIFYLGPAVFWTPAVWVLKHFVRHHGDPRVVGACVGFIPANVLTLSSLAGAVVVLVTGALARRWTSPRIAALAALLATLGGHLIYFTALNPSYSHAYDAMCVALLLYLAVRLRERPESLRLAALAGLALGLAILQRSSNAVFFVVAVGALVRWPTNGVAVRRAVRPLTVVGLVALASGLLPLLAANRAIFGRWLLYAHGPHFLQPAHAHPWLLLFDERGGLFGGAPVLWLAVPGVVLLARLRDARWLAVPLLFCAFFELYLSASALDWQGARRLTNLTPLGALCLALTLERGGRWLFERPRRAQLCAALAALALVAWANGSVCFAFAHGHIPWDQPLTTSERYGEGNKQGLAAVESDVGALPVVPAAWVFAARYGLAPMAFGWAAHPRWYQRDLHSLEYLTSAFPFAESETRPLLRGLHVESGDRGACFEGQRASAVFSAQWPFATRVRLVYDASAPARLSIQSRSFLGFTTPWARDLALPAGKGAKVMVPVPPGGFDSGLNELELERASDSGPSGTASTLCLHRLEMVDDVRYAAAPETLASPSTHVWQGDRYVEDGASVPAVAVAGGVGGPASVWTAEVHETRAGQVAVTLGTLALAGAPRTLDGKGYAPRVAAVSDTALVEVHQGQTGAGPLWLRTGQMTLAASGPQVVWSEHVQYGSGYHPAIAAGRGQLVEMHMSDPASPNLSFRTANWTGSGPIAWRDPQPLGVAGYHPAVAIAPDVGVVLEVHQKDATAGPLWMRTGKLAADGTITWTDAVHYDSGIFPTIAVRGKRVVELHQGQDASGALWMKTGTLDADGHVEWVSNKSYDSGAQPAIAVDASTGAGVEVHAGNLGYTSLWTHDLEVY